MSESTDGQHQPWGMVVLLCLILLGVAATILLTLELRGQIGAYSRPDQSIPTCRVQRFPRGSFSKIPNARRSC